MKLATTIGELYPYFVPTSAEAVRCCEGTGFTHLDYSFYEVLRPGCTFMGDNWKAEVTAAGEAAALGFDFVQAHSPDYTPWTPKPTTKPACWQRSALSRPAVCWASPRWWYIPALRPACSTRRRRTPILPKRWSFTGRFTPIWKSTMSMC